METSVRAGLAGLVGLAALALAGGAAAQPPADAYLVYDNVQTLVEGAGAYAGYRERTLARGRVEVLGRTDEAADLRARYRWLYESPEGVRRGAEDRRVMVGIPDRRYRSAQTDLDEYDAYDPATLEAWLWIPLPVEEGQEVAILGETFRVVSAGTPVEAPGGSRLAVHLRGTYEGVRDDDYGRFRRRTTDEYFFDAATGLFLREVVREENTGELDGSSASFTLVTTIAAVDASWAPSGTPIDDDLAPEALRADLPALDPPVSVYDLDAPRDSSGGGLGAPGPVGTAVLVVLAALALVFGWRKIRGRNVPLQTAAGARFRVEELSPATALPKGTSRFLDPFLPHIVAVARRAGEKVLCARDAGDGAILGLGVGDVEADLGTIFATDSDVCEALRARLGAREFFSELRHPALASAIGAGLSTPPQAYNLYETFDVMVCEERPAELGYDAALVSPFAPQDEEPIGALLRAVYGVFGRVWLRASLDEGDLAFCAREGGGVVGVAMATLVGTDARLQLLTVHPEARGRGIGTALMRARLRALFELGAARVVTEVATWNVAAGEIARAHGFVKVGEIFVESARDRREERRFLRR